jgi:hypothetical protein
MQVKRDITLDIMNDKQEYDSNTITIIYNENTTNKSSFCPYCGRKKYILKNLTFIKILCIHSRATAATTLSFIY